MLPEQVKSELNFMEETFNKEFVSLDVLHEGSKGYAEFNYIYCTYCTQNKLPEVLNQNKDKLPTNLKIESLLEKWDKIKLSNSWLNLCGCLLPNEVHVKSAPNARCFIVRPSEHASSCHMPSKSSKSSTSATPPTKQTTLIIKENGKVSTAKPAATSVSKNKQVTITVKHNKKLKLMDVGKMFDNILSITEHSEDSIDNWSEDFCIQTVLTGISIHNH